MSPEVADDLHAKLAAAGLVAPRGTKATVTHGELVVSYIKRRTDVKPATVMNWRHTKRCLFAYFGIDRDVSSITSAEARDWQRWLRTGKAREHGYLPVEKGG